VPSIKIHNLESAGQDAVDYEAFRQYLETSKNRRVARDYVNYAKRFQDCLLKGDLTKLLTLSPGKKRMVSASLSALAKFLGVYDQWKQLRIRYGLKWAGKSASDLVLDRFTKVEDPGEVYAWILQVKKARPELTDFIDLMAITGMRFIEAINSYNLIIDLDRQAKIGEYYNFDDEILKHYKFKETFIRKNKKIFISFVPKELIYRIIGNKLKVKSRDSVQKRVHNRGLKSRFADMREAHATFMTKHLKESEINFLHGRVSTSVFMRNYFNPALILDLKTRAFKGIQEIQNKI